MNNAELIGQIRSLLDRLERGETSAEAAVDELTEVMPAWHPKPTCAGLWATTSRCRGLSFQYWLESDLAGYWSTQITHAYGPIPEPTK